MKHILLQFIHDHKDSIQASLVGTGGLGALFTNIDIGLKILVTAVTLGFIIWKWRCAYLDRKNKK